MIPIFLLKVLPDIVASAAATYIVKYVVPKVVAKGTEKVIAKASNKIIKSSDFVIKNNTNIENSTVKAVETIKKVKSLPLNEASHIKYCVLVSYVYGKYGDEDLLQILKDRGCIDEEDIKYLTEEIEK